MENTFTGNDQKSYVLQPLTLGDNKRFVRWVKYRALDEFEQLKGQLAEDIYSAEYQRLLQECNSKDLHEASPEVEAMEKRAEGLAYTIFLSLKKTYPDITVGQVDELLTAKNLGEVYQKLMILSGLIAKKNDASSAEKSNSKTGRVKRAASQSPATPNE